MPDPRLQPSEQYFQTRAGWRFAVDRGGTFTDVVGFAADGTLHTAKVLSHDPTHPGDPALRGICTLLDHHADAHGRDVLAVRLGTTVATNALLEGKGVRTGLLITRGFRAVYEARGWSQPRGSDLLDTFYQKPPLLAPQWLTEEVRERLDYRGEVVTPLDEAQSAPSAPSDRILAPLPSATWVKNRSTIDKASAGSTLRR